MSLASNVNLPVSIPSSGLAVDPAGPRPPVQIEPSNSNNLATNQPRLSNHEITNSPLKQNGELSNSGEFLADHTALEPRAQSVGDEITSAPTTTDITTFSQQNNMAAISVAALKKAALSGDMESQFELGEHYFDKDNVDIDDVKAAVYFRLAAEQGHVDAQYNLAAMYELGMGVEKDKSQAAEWYAKAAAKQHLRAQYRLGLLYQAGSGVNQNDFEAVDFFTQSANQGHADAQYELGCMYDSGKGVAADRAKAFDWYLKSALQGNRFAQFEVGLRYLIGDVVKRDVELANDWFTKAAEQGMAEAQLALFTAYLGGSEKFKNDKLGTYWLLKSGLHPDGQSIVLHRIPSLFANYSAAAKLIPATLKKYKDFLFVKEIQFQYKHVCGKNFSFFGDLIRANTQLEILHLSGKSLSDADALLIENSLHNNTNLKEIVLAIDVNENLKNQILLSLEENIAISTLHQFMQDHPPKRSDFLPLEVLEILVDKLIVAYLKSGSTLEDTKKSLNEFLVSAAINSVANN